MNKITLVEEDKYTKEHFGELVDDSDIQAKYPWDSVSIFFSISLNLINQFRSIIGTDLGGILEC